MTAEEAGYLALYFKNLASAASVIPAPPIAEDVPPSQKTLAQLNAEQLARLKEREDAKARGVSNEEWAKYDALYNTAWMHWMDRLRNPKTEPKAPAQRLPASGPPAGTLKTTRMSDVVAKPIEPLWPGFLYKGKVTVLAGIPGDGKSLTAVDLAARISTGKPWPVGEGEFAVASVLLLTAEDDPEDTIRPRLDVALADTGRIELIQGVHRVEVATGDRSLDAVSLANDLPAIERKISDATAAVLIIDLLTSFADSDTNETAAMRRLLDGLVGIAARTGVAILIITHMNKRSDARKAMQMIAGNHVIVAAVRVVLVTARDPNDTDRVLLLPIKLNIGPRNLGFGFRVGVKTHPIAGKQPMVEWEPEMVGDMSADDVLIDSTPRAQAAVEKSKEVQAWLREVLAKGPVEANELWALAKLHKYSERKVRDALTAIKAVSIAQGFPAKWRYELGPNSGPVVPQPPMIPTPPGA
jgi:putative DNA primase/helicase